MMPIEPEPSIREILRKELSMGISCHPMPDIPFRDTSIPRATKRILNLTEDEKYLAIQNALRYFSEEHHDLLAKEFAKELQDYGHIYMYRFRPTTYEIKAYPIDYYTTKSRHGNVLFFQKASLFFF
jgi:urocanate hydratase